METKPQTVVRLRVAAKNGYCPVFSLGDAIVLRKHCFDTALNGLGKYCYATLADVYPVYARVRRLEVGAKERFRCRDNGIIELEVERLPDEPYDFENPGCSAAPLAEPRP